MLSIMETPAGLTMVNPYGLGSIRIPVSNPNYKDARKLVQSGLPVQQVWEKAQAMLQNPRLAFNSWLSQFGIALSEDTTEESAPTRSGFFKFGGFFLSEDVWWEWLNKLKECGGNPQVALNFLETLSNQRPAEEIEQFRIKSPLLFTPGDDGPKVRFFDIVSLPENALPGDKVCAVGIDGFPGQAQFAIAYDKIGSRGEMVEGVVLYKYPKDALKFKQDVLSQPMLLGFNQTYRCQEGSSDGWLETLQTDSLLEAKEAFEEVQAAGYEARIVNRITGLVIT